MSVCTAPFGTSQVSWIEFKDDQKREQFYANRDKIRQKDPEADLPYYRSAVGFVYHNYLTTASGWCSADEETGDPNDTRQIRIWNAVKELIPSFGDYKRIEIADEFRDRVFSRILPGSPFVGAYRYQNVALRVIAFVLLLMEIPIRYIWTFIFKRIMDIYSFKNPNFAEYYKFRATISAGQPIAEILKFL